MNIYACSILLLLLSLFTPSAHGLWWSISNQPLMNHNQLCRRARRIRGPLRTTCRKEPMVMSAVMNGSKTAMSECRYQFKDRRWNCSSQKKSLKKILMRDMQETAVLNAIMSAGITHSITEGCSSGEVPHCSCAHFEHQYQYPQKTKDNSLKNSKYQNRFKNIKKDHLNHFNPPRKKRSSRHQLGFKSKPSYRNEIPYPDQSETSVEHHWGGCPDNINYGYKKSRRLMDRKYRKSHKDTRTQVMLHNNEAGRLAVKNNMRVDCKCHGLSGSCNFKTCWKRIRTFREIGQIIKNKYLRATKVISSNDGKGLILAEYSRSQKRPKKEDLVFLEDSPDFCSLNRKYGSDGTNGRECNATTAGKLNCEILCCGRPYRQQIMLVQENCRCKFHFCCEVTCDVCIYNKTITYCT